MYLEVLYSTIHANLKIRINSNVSVLVNTTRSSCPSPAEGAIKANFNKVQYPIKRS